MTPAASNPRLYDGETLAHAGGAPCFYKYLPADRHNPLVVLIPGGAHNARIFYGGHPGHEPRDFLTTWLTEMNFGVLAISYPVESDPEILPSPSPGFRIHDWGRQAAEVTRDVIEAHDLCRGVVLVAWSMGGRLLVPYCKTAETLGITTKLFVSLSATPGLPGIRPSPSNISSTPTGYASMSALLPHFLHQLHAQNMPGVNGEHAIPDQAYRERYFAHTPVALLGWCLKYDEAKAGFVDDEGRGERDAAAHEFHRLPWIASLTPTSPLDARHALSDKATWGFMLVQRLTSLAEQAMGRQGASQVSWPDLVAFVDSAPAALSASVEGNHFFFVGRNGAKATAEGIVRHLHSAVEMESRLHRILGLSSWASSG